MIRLIKNDNYIESYKQLKFVDKIKLSTSFFKQSEIRKLFIKNNGKYIYYQNVDKMHYFLLIPKVS